MGQAQVSPATYWRRRVVVLAACLAVLTVLTWSVNLVFSSIGATGQRSPGSHAAAPGERSQGGQVRSQAGSGQAGHRQALTGETADLGLQRGADPQPSASLSERPPASRSDAGAAPLPGLAGQACASRNVALTLRSSQHRYGPSTLVTFVVGAVSSGSRPCRVNLGSRFVSVVVAASGTPLWDSSSCLRGTGSQVVTLRRGVPAFLQVTWDQRTTLSGCPGKGSTVRAGTYTAAAFYGQLRSHAVSFVLTGRGAAAP